MINLELTYDEWYFLHWHLENIIKENPDNRIAKPLLEKIANNKPNLSGIKSLFKMEHESVWVDGEGLYILPSNPNDSIKIVFENKGEKNMDKDKKYIESIGKITRDSTKTIENALNSIKSKIEADDKIKKYLKGKDIDVEGKDFDGVLEEISQKWNDFSDSEKLDISINIAGRYQMTRFNILMNELSEGK